VGLTIAELLPDYRASLNDAALVFGQDNSDDQKKNLTRHLTIAARKLAIGKRPRTRQATLSLVADQSSYGPVPEDLLLTKVSTWGITNRPQWHLPAGPLPILTLVDDDGTGSRAIVLTPAPTSEQICAFGSSYPFYYFAEHAITSDAATSTLQEKDRGLVILGGQVEAMREMAMRSIGKPVTLRDANGGGVARNMTPAALYEKLLAEFNEAP
jgi:hypothetical protein